jgi:hypothetical protein
VTDGERGMGGRHLGPLPFLAIRPRFGRLATLGLKWFLGGEHMHRSISQGMN